MTWALKEELQKKLKKESGYFAYPPGSRERFALVYPNSYFVGTSNLGLHIVYKILNSRDDTACERFFVPESFSEYERTKTPLMSLETQTPLFDFPLIGFAVSFEMDYFNVLKILESGRVKVLASDRGNRDPIVIAGGPCATFNPEPLSEFIDAFVIGEAEVILPALMNTYYEVKDRPRDEILFALSGVSGVYVPSFYNHIHDEEGKISKITPINGVPRKVFRQWVKKLDDFPANTVINTPDTEFDMHLIETARGCGRHCRFCMAGYAFRKPRNRSLAVISEQISEAKESGRKIGLMGAAVSDHPDIDLICDKISESGLKMSVASFRADSVTQNLTNSLSKSGLKTMTIAPEAGSVRMRSVINKGIEEEHIFKALDMGMKSGIKNYRMYIMIGLPYETIEDVEETAKLSLRVKKFIGKGALTLSVNPFIPKPFTPFQWLPMAKKNYNGAALKLLRKSLPTRMGITIISESLKISYIQGILSRGDRRISKAVYEAHKAGGEKEFLRTMNEMNLDENFYLFRMRERDEIFPWDAIDIGVRREYLYSELIRAEKMEKTAPCFDGCKRCGICE